MPRSVRCPRDGAQAKVEEHEGNFGRFKLDVCPTCSGVWFDRGEIARLTNSRDLERLIVDYAGGASRMACPRCNGPMAQRPVGGVVIDVCVNCEGVWMDRGEIETAALTLGQPSVPRGGPELHARDLALATWLSPGMREALLNSASRTGFRSP